MKKLNPDYNLAEKSCHFLTLEFKNCEEIPSISPYFKKKIFDGSNKDLSSKLKKRETDIFCQMKASMYSAIFVP